MAADFVTWQLFVGIQDDPVVAAQIQLHPHLIPTHVLCLHLTGPHLKEHLINQIPRFYASLPCPGVLRYEGEFNIVTLNRGATPTQIMMGTFKQDLRPQHSKSSDVTVATAGEDVSVRLLGTKQKGNLEVQRGGYAMLFRKDAIRQKKPNQLVMVEST